MCGRASDAMAQFDLCLAADPKFYLGLCGKVNSRGTTRTQKTHATLSTPSSSDDTPFWAP
jgi:hypothetical protein